MLLIDPSLLLLAHFMFFIVPFCPLSLAISFLPLPIHSLLFFLPSSAHPLYLYYLWSALVLLSHGSICFPPISPYSSLPLAHITHPFHWPIFISSIGPYLSLSYVASLLPYCPDPFSFYAVVVMFSFLLAQALPLIGPFPLMPLVHIFLRIGPQLTSPIAGTAIIWLSSCMQVHLLSSNWTMSHYAPPPFPFMSLLRILFFPPRPLNELTINSEHFSPIF